MRVDKLLDLLKNIHWVYMYIGGKLLKWIPDRQYLGIMYFLYFHRRINWNNPKRLTEKIQWSKVYDHNPLYTQLVDKYVVKEIVSNKIGIEHVIPTIGVWNCFDDIDFNSLPDQFVLKTTHDSGGSVICKDKNVFDYQRAKKKINKHLKRNFYWSGREWAYKYVKPRIIAEPYIDTLGKRDSIEYKITCFNGVARNITVCRGIAHDALKNRNNDNYTRKLRHLKWWTYYKNGKSGFVFPEAIYDIVHFAEILSEKIPYVRVDFYYENGKVLFGEMTFYTWGGFMRFHPDETDIKLGRFFKLPVVD